MADERILQIILQAKDQATAVIESVGKNVEKTGGIIEKMSTQFKIAGSVMIGAGVAGGAMMLDWVNKAANAQEEMARVDAILGNTAKAMQFTTEVIKGNEGAIKSQTDAIESQLKQRQAQLTIARLTDNKTETEAIQKQIAALKIQEAQLVQTAVVKDKVVQVANKNALSFERLRQITDEVSASYIRLGFDDETTANVFAKNLSITKDTAEAKKLLGLQADLARAKGIGLAEAGQAVTLAMMGSSRILKQWGIELEDNATKEQIFAALQEKVGGTAEKASGTYKVAMERMGVQITNIKEKLGERLLPTITNFIDKITVVIDRLNSANPQIFDTIVKITALATAFAFIGGPILLFLGFLPTITAGFGILMGAILPVTAIILGLAAVAYIFYQTWTNNWGGIQEKVQAVVSWLQQLPAMIMPFITQFILILQQIFTVISQNVMQFVVAVAPLFQSAWQNIQNAIQFGLTIIWNIWQAIWPALVQIFSGVWEAIQGIFQIAWGLLQLGIAVGLAVISGDWSKAWNAVKVAFEDIWNGLVKFFTGIWETIKGIIRGGINAIIGMLNGFIENINRVGAKVGVNIGKIPTFQEGGLVAQTGPAFLHAGEYVLSRDMLIGRKPAPAFATTNYNSPININVASVRGMEDIDSIAHRLDFYLRTSGRI